jgi:hypothetical protein
MQMSSDKNLVKAKLCFLVQHIMNIVLHTSYSFFVGIKQLLGLAVTQNQFIV